MEKTTKRYGLALLFLTACWFGMIIAVAMEASLRPKTPELLPEHKGLMFVKYKAIMPCSFVLLIGYSYDKCSKLSYVSSSIILVSYNMIPV